MSTSHADGTEQAKILACKFLEALSAGAADELQPLLADDFAWWTPQMKPPQKMDKAAAIATVRQLPGIFGNLSIAPISGGITAQSDRVAIEAESRGTMTSTGKVYGNVYHFLFEIRLGRIKTVKEYCDTQHRAEALGI